MTVRLRPHHLLCVLTYVGKGYSAAFVANLDAITARLASGEGVLIVDGPDDVCAPLLEEDDAHCTGASVQARDAAATRDLAAVLGEPVASGVAMTLDASRVSKLRCAFASGWIRTACAGCQWARLCDDVVGKSFAETRLVTAG